MNHRSVEHPYSQACSGYGIRVLGLRAYCQLQPHMLVWTFAHLLHALRCTPVCKHRLSRSFQVFIFRFFALFFPQLFYLFNDLLRVLEYRKLRKPRRIYVQRFGTSLAIVSYLARLRRIRNSTPVLLVARCATNDPPRRSTQPVTF